MTATEASSEELSQIERQEIGNGKWRQHFEGLLQKKVEK